MIAIVVPKLGGGVQRHATEMAQAFGAQGDLVVLILQAGKINQVTLLQGSERSPVYDYFQPAQNEQLVDLLKALKVNYIHYHHLLGLSEFLKNLWKDLDAQYSVTLHDYYWICPRVQLVDKDYHYCGVPQDSAECTKCMNLQTDWIQYFHQVKTIPIDAYRKRNLEFLKKADRVFIPDEDLRARINKVFPSIQLTVFPNPEVAKVPEVKPYLAAKTNDMPIRIGVLGVISKVKGEQQLIDLAALIDREKKPIRLVLFGELASQKRCSFDSLVVKGRYEEHEIYGLIQREQIDYFWFPSICPETYSYTLSIPVRLNIPVLGTNLGAIGRRIVDNGWGEVYPYEFDAESICKRMLEFPFDMYRKKQMSLTNTVFPSPFSLYGIEKVRREEVNLLGVVKALSRNSSELVERIQSTKLKGMEIRTLLGQRLSWLAKVQLLAKTDPLWVLQKVAKLFSRSM